MERCISLKSSSHKRVKSPNSSFQLQLRHRIELLWLNKLLCFCWATVNDHICIRRLWQTQCKTLEPDTTDRDTGLKERSTRQAAGWDGDRIKNTPEELSRSDFWSFWEWELGKAVRDTPQPGGSCMGGWVASRQQENAEPSKTSALHPCED